jgi:hypothetical protein
MFDLNHIAKEGVGTINDAAPLADLMLVSVLY